VVTQGCRVTLLRGWDERRGVIAPSSGVRSSGAAQRSRAERLGEHFSSWPGLPGASVFLPWMGGTTPMFTPGLSVPQFSAAHKVWAFLKTFEAFWRVVVEGGAGGCRRSVRRLEMNGAGAGKLVG
jgi:hypothetical protein